MAFRVFTIKRVKKFSLIYFFPSLFQKGNKNIVLQFRELIYLARAGSYWPHNYFKYKVYKKDQDVKKYVFYIPGVLYDAIRADHLNNEQFCFLVDNKLIFNQFMRFSKIKTTEIQGRYSKADGFYDRENNAKKLTHFLSSVVDDLVIKPTKSSVAGAATFVVEIDPIKRAFQWEGKRYSAEEFACLISQDWASNWDELLFENKIRQHPFMSQLYPHSVNTIRIDTLRAKNGESLILGAFLRVGRAGKKVDNWYRGGITIGINPSEGSLKRIGYDYLLNEFESHPESQFVFLEAKIPHWEDVVSLARRCATVFPHIHSVGWDIALTEDGPLVIEGNTDSGIFPIQLNGEPLLKRKEFILALLEFIEGKKTGKNYRNILNRFNPPPQTQIPIN